MGRYIHQNVLGASGVVFTPSAQQPGFPVRRLLDPMPSLEWRTPVGLTVGPLNDRLDFTRSATPFAADLTHGTYATPADVAAHVAARMNAQDANSYVLTPVGPRFTIAGTAAFDLDFATGPNLARSVAPDLGHNATDKSGASSYVGDSDAYHSRAWVVFDLGAAVAIAGAVVHQHNVAAAGIVRLEGNAADVWTAPAFSQVLAAEGTKRLAYFTEASHRYWRLFVDDRTNADAFTRAGIAWAGPFLQPALGHTLSEGQGQVGQSELIRAAQGAAYQLRRQQGGRWSIAQEALTPTERDAFKALGDQVRIGGVLMWTRTLTDLSDTQYVRLLNHVQPERDPRDADLWRVSLELEEVLG